ncbi:MAG: circadian clock protein KaiC [Nitrospiraceae bacterium]
MSQQHPDHKELPSLPKAQTGNIGFDEITGGGLPRGRPTLVTGGPGSGKTLFGLEFLVRGAMECAEPGVFMSFEETEQEIKQNAMPLGFDLTDLAKRGLVTLDFVRVEPSEIEETGEYDLEGLFVRLGLAIDQISAKRVVLDTLEALFAALPNQGILRAELRRLFRWLKDHGVTAIITAERGEGAFTRHGLEEYVSDCVILLDHRVADQISTRRLRVVKYRGSAHGTNEFPFFIDQHGISVLPITSLSLTHEAPTERMSTGIEELDTMLDGKGLYRGSSTLVSGTPGSGKSSLVAHAIHAACQRGERCLYFPMEESQAQILRNMQSIGLDLQRWVSRGLLRFRPARPYQYGLETHLAVMHREIAAFEPQVVAIDPLTNLVEVGNVTETKAMATRLIDFLKVHRITSIFTSLTSDSNDPEMTQLGISSLMDTWLLVRNLESNGERNRGLYILKSRGMPHSNQIREFVLTDHGAKLMEVYTGSAGVLTGTARLVQEQCDKAQTLALHDEINRKRRELDSKRTAVEARIALLQAEFASEASELEALIEQRRQAEDALAKQHAVLRGRRENRPPDTLSDERNRSAHESHQQRPGKINGRNERARTQRK